MTRISPILLSVVILLLTSCQNKSIYHDEASHKTTYIYDHESFVRRSGDSPVQDDFMVNHATYYRHRYYQPFYPVKLETYENSFPEFQNFIAQHGYHSSYHPLIGIVTEDPSDVLEVNQLLVYIQENVKNKKQMRLMTDEVLTKVLAYRNLQLGQKVPIPVIVSKTTSRRSKTQLATSRLVMYHVDNVFDLSAGMPAFGLIPDSDKSPPILLFRGTDLSSSLKGITSVLADLDLNGPGLSVFYSAQEDLHRWLENVSLSHARARVMGYSLGGSFTQYTCIYEHELICKDPNFPSIAFNQQGISEDLIYKWEHLPQEKRPNLRGYVTEGDLVSTVGKLIGHVKELSLDHLLEPLFAHVTLMSVQQRLYMYRIDVTLKNELDHSVHKQEFKELFHLLPENR